MSNSKFVTESVPDKTCVVVGTRPGIIKMSPIIAELERRNASSFTIHAGQHYSYKLDAKIFEDLKLNEPKHRIDGIEQTEYHGEQTAKMLDGIEEVLLEEQPENILVCGDANFNLAGALAGRKLRLNVGHVEAGLRSNDWRMPEEHNRVMIDHISDCLFVPTNTAKQNAVEDNVKGKIINTGNTIVDAVYRNSEFADEESSILSELGIKSSEYAVFTAHREENVDDKDTLSQLIEIIDEVSREQDLQVVYPIHPRTDKRLEQFDMTNEIRDINGLKIVDPLGYIDFLKLMTESDVILTDSGGIQEESCILQIPCVTLRENTERPETVDVGSNIIAGTDPDEVLIAVNEMRQQSPNWSNPFGDGTAAEQIINTMIGEET